MDSRPDWHAEEPARALRFTGNWREFLPIAATNLLLTIVTLGIYRFWATARERRYLWSRTEFIDDSLEWTGTGKEMFVGFLMIAAVLLPMFLVFQLLVPAMVARGMEVAAGLVVASLYVTLLYLGGVARFRALRYRLSRTRWHGIRGGSDNPGWAYGAEYLGRYFVAIITLFFMFPWALTRLWARRWNAMSFGPLAFRSTLTASGLIRRWLLLYAIAGLGMLSAVALMGAAFVSGSEGSGVGLAGLALGIFLLLYVAVPLATLHWFAKFYRRAAEHMTLGELSFRFDARTRDWLKLILGNFGLAIITLGLGIMFWGYRNWSFMVRHMHVHGTVDLSELTQSRTTAPGEAEGFADMFDVGAI